jgi:DNA-binding NarL/FixJ family response regulator|nr:MAG TPA: response regulator [Bacteriophage sp.]
MKLSKLTKPELDEIINNANFTEEEIEVFKLLARGKTITEIAQQVSVCNRTVNRRIKKIKSKISRLEG